VTVSQPFTFLTPLIGNLFGGSLTLTTSATAPVMNPLVASVVTQTSTSTSSTTTSTTTTSTTTTTTATTSTTTTTTAACVPPVVTITTSPKDPSSHGNSLTLDVTFTGSATPGTVTTWAWNFGDSGTSDVANPPTHTYTYTGTKDDQYHPTEVQTWKVTLTVVTTPGCTGVQTVTVTVGK
jgi:PKD domain